MKYKPGTFILVPNIERLDVLPAIAQALFMWLCKYSDDDGICYPSRRKLAGHLSCDVRTIDKHMIFLEETGFILKTKRSKPNSKENMSNLYQLQIIRQVEELIPHPSESNDTTPSEPNVPVTISNTNYNHLTIVPDDTSDANQDVKMELPKKFGLNAYTRLGHVYRQLWFSKYGMAIPSFPFAKFNKVIKDLLVENNEYQIAILLLTYFNWRGASGNDEKEYSFISGKGFPIEMMPSKINIMIAYLTNVGGIVYNGEEDVRQYAVKHLKNVL